MRYSSTGRFFSALAVGLLLLGSTSCYEVVRVPLAVPLPVVGGARPATPQGLEIIAEFGDGVWGQEQERAEMVGAGIGVAINDRIELSSNAFASSRGIKDSSGDEHHGETSVALRGKMRLGDFADGRGAFGVHVAYSYAERERDDVQDERLSALDLAFPVEFYRAGGLFAGAGSSGSSSVVRGDASADSGARSAGDSTASRSISALSSQLSRRIPRLSGASPRAADSCQPRNVSARSSGESPRT